MPNNNDNDKDYSNVTGRARQMYVLETSPSAQSIIHNTGNAENWKTFSKTIY